MFSKEINVHGVYEELDVLGEIEINLNSQNERMFIVGDDELYRGESYAVILSHASGERVVGRYPFAITSSMHISSEFFRIKYSEGEGGFYKPNVRKEYYTELSEMPKMLNRFIKILVAQFSIFNRMLPSQINEMSTRQATFEIERNSELLEYRVVTNANTRGLYTACILDLVSINKRDAIKAKQEIKEQRRKLKEEIQQEKKRQSIVYENNNSEGDSAVIMQLTGEEMKQLGIEFSEFLHGLTIDRFLENRDYEGLKKYLEGAF